MAVVVSKERQQLRPVCVCSDQVQQPPPPKTAVLAAMARAGLAGAKQVLQLHWRRRI